MADLPFEHLNLRRNPFGELPEGARSEVAVVDVDRYGSLLETPGTAVEFVGESGRGKTTHLLAIADAIEEVVHVEAERDGAPPQIPAGETTLVDEYQFLAPADRRRFAERSGSIAIGTHVSFGEELRALGFEVESVRLAGEGAPRMREIVEKRIDWARRSRGPVPEIADATLERLRELYGDDLRAAEHHLYEVFQLLERPRAVVPADLGRIEHRPIRSDGRTAGGLATTPDV